MIAEHHRFREIFLAPGSCSSSVVEVQCPGDLLDLSYFKAASTSLLSVGGLGSCGEMVKFLRATGLGLIGRFNFSWKCCFHLSLIPVASLI